jgi:hypothetical protein
MSFKHYGSDFADDILAEMLEKLAAGESMSSICSDKRMPDQSTIWRWSKADDELARDIARAREVGYVTRAERAVDNAKTAEDAAKGRLAFDAERWYLGKLSNAFSDDKKRELKVEHSLSPEAAKWLGLS